MRNGLLSYKEAAVFPGVARSELTLRRAASNRTPWQYRLKVVRQGHWIVGIWPADLIKWSEGHRDCCDSFFKKIQEL